MGAVMPNGTSAQPREVRVMIAAIYAKKSTEQTSVSSEKEDS